MKAEYQLLSPLQANLLPVLSNVTVMSHTEFLVLKISSYVEKVMRSVMIMTEKIPSWVAYRLTPDSVNKKFKRSNKFKPDTEIPVII